MKVWVSNEWKHRGVFCLEAEQDSARGQLRAHGYPYTFTLGAGYHPTREAAIKDARKRATKHIAMLQRKLGAAQKALEGLV